MLDLNTGGTTIARPESQTARLLEDRRLLSRYHRSGDPAAREALVQRFLPLVRQLARRYQRAGEPLDDLVQVGCVGLLKAIERFDLQRSTAFSSFAVPTIVGELKRYFRDAGWFVRVPRSLQDLSARVDRAADELEGRLGRAPTVAELAVAVGAAPEEVLEAREAIGAHHALSLNRPVGNEDGAEELGEAIGAEDPGYAIAEAAATVERLTCELSVRDRLVLYLRFDADMTQSEIGAVLGVSQMHVSRIVRQAIATLQETAEGPRVAARSLR